VTVVNIDVMVLHANATESEVAKVKAGGQASITLDSLPGSRYTGRIARISPLLDPQTRNGAVEIEIENNGRALKGEMFARAEIEIGENRQTLLLPRDALVYRGEQPGAYLLDGETARFRVVETGLTQGDKVEVLSGLAQNDVVITRGANLIKDGDRVAVNGAGQP
jgi:RND family efflux transporter MFP subunit